MGGGGGLGVGLGLGDLFLQCDASQTGLGPWLRQVDATGNERIVAMASSSLTDAESRYSNIERECLAVMSNIAKAPTRLQRLLLRCLKFDIEVKYRRGENIPVADALSRVCLKKEERTHVSNKSD